MELTKAKKPSTSPTNPPKALPISTASLRDPDLALAQNAAALLGLRTWIWNVPSPFRDFVCSCFTAAVVGLRYLPYRSLHM